jgi:hypothetical protein
MNIFLVDTTIEYEAMMEMFPLIFSVLAVFVVGEVTLRGKESLFIFKKAPAGVGRLVKTRLLHGWLVVIPITVAIIVIRTILFSQTTYISLLTNTGIIALIVAAYVVFALGLSLLNPAFSTKSGSFILNVMIVPQTGVALIILTRANWGIYIPIIWFIGIIFIYLGMRKLKRIE